MSDSLSVRDYTRIADLLQKQAGIRLPPGKRSMVEGRLRRRVRCLELSDLGEYCRLLFDEGALDDEFTFLIDALTTNKTDFFREPQHFEFVRTHAVPRLLSESPNRRLKVWSAGCSNGAEPFTLAMVLADMATRSFFQFAILGTDICTNVLDVAQTAIYPTEMVSPVPADLAQRYLMRARNRAVREVRIVPELRRLVRFMRLNLIETSYSVDRDVDIIFCRNVLIYFDHNNQRAVVERLSRHLRRGGYLFLGHSDCVAGDSNVAMRQVAIAVFQRQ